MGSPVSARRADAAAEDSGGSSQSLRAQLALREMIVGGELPAGERIAELAMVDRLAMSRTPIRTALVRLQEEGLLEPLPGGGYTVDHSTQLVVFDPQGRLAAIVRPPHDAAAILADLRTMAAP